MIYIIRHGETDWNQEGRCQGRADIELNSKGIEQAKKISDQLKNIEFDMVFSSPLKRAYCTAQIIRSNKIVVDNRIIERNNGKLEGMLKAEYIELINFNDLSENEYEVEPLEEFRSRINNFLDETITNYKNKNVLIVTHAGVSIYMKCYFEGEPIDGNFHKLKLKNCEVLIYSNESDQSQIWYKKTQELIFVFFN